MSNKSHMHVGGWGYIGVLSTKSCPLKADLLLFAFVTCPAKLAWSRPKCHISDKVVLQIYLTHDCHKLYNIYITADENI